MVAEAAEGVGRDGGGDDFVEELDAIAGAVEAGAELVVVGELVGEGCEAADGGECGFGGRERGAEAEAEAAFECAGDECAGDEVGGDAEGFEA